MKKRKPKRQVLGECALSDFMSCLSTQKAQVTVFIILGILLVLAAVIIIALARETAIFTPKTATPAEPDAIRAQIESCISTLGTDALAQIGLTGGYIAVPDELVHNTFVHLQLAPSLVLPYWLHGNTKNIPALGEIKVQVDNHINTNLQSCLQSLSSFTEQYEIIPKSAIESDVVFTDEQTVFALHYVIEVRKKDGTLVKEFTDYETTSSIRFKKTYETAKALIEAEHAQLKFEDITIDLLALDHPNLPLAGTDLSCTEKTWKVDKAEETLKSLLRYNLKKLKVESTAYLNFPKELDYYQNHYIWDIGIREKSIAVQFAYEDSFPLAFQVTPRDGNTLSSSTLSGQKKEFVDLASLCIQTWKFTYDVSYPVLASIVDQKSGYIFNTAFTVHVVRNAPKRAGVAPIPQTTALALAETPANEDFCSSTPLFPLTVQTFKKIENKETGIFVRAPASNVNITFVCLKYRCPMGTSAATPGGYLAAATAAMPYCVDAIVRAEKPQHKEAFVVINANQPQVAEIDLIPLHHVPAKLFSIKKHDSATGQIKEAAKEESLLIRLTRADGGKLIHDQTLLLDPATSPTIAEEQMLTLLAGTTFTYQLELQLFGGEGGEQFKGGYKGNWTVDWKNLSNAKEIEFHLVSKEKFASEEEQYALLLNLEEKSRGIPQPVIKSG